MHMAQAVWTLKAMSRLAKEAGASGVMNDALEARATRRAVVDAKRKPLARGMALGSRWERLWEARRLD